MLSLSYVLQEMLPAASEVAFLGKKVIKPNDSYGDIYCLCVQ